MRRPNRRTGLFFALLTSMALLATAVVPVHAQLKVSIGTGRDPNLGAQVIIARNMGFFKEAGLDADVKYFPSGGDLMAAVVGGSVMYGSAGSTPVTVLRARPFPIRILSRISDISGAQQIIVKQSLNAPGELYGKKVGIMRGTASESLFNAFAKNYAFDASKVELVNMAPAEMLTAFVRGDVGAIVVWEPHTTKARHSGSGKVLVSGTRSAIPGAVGEKRIYGDHAVLFAPEAVIKDNAKATQALLGALARATDYLRTNRSDALAILAKEFGFDARAMDEIAAANDYTMEINQQLAADLDALAVAMHAAGRLKNPLKAREWIDPEPLRAVRASLVNLR